MLRLLPVFPSADACTLVPISAKQYSLKVAKKKKTLPKNFKELIEHKDIEAFKKVFDTCELDARGGYGKSTALGFYNVPNELVRWLVENGADIDATDTYKRTALHNHAMICSGNVTIFLELGATIDATDYNGNTALHFASGNGFNVGNVKKLIEYGANPHALNNAQQTPLDYALQRANNIDIAALVAISGILLKTDDKITQSRKDAVARRGKDFEFHREHFNKAYLKETDEALTKLYEIYGVAPVKKRITHDGVSTIKVNGTTWQQQYEELWELLIPSNGSAKTMQGEVVRIAGKVRDEIYRNGGANWDADFKQMLDTFIAYLSSGVSLQSDELEQAGLIVKAIRKNGDGEIDELIFLSELATKWVLLNPNPISPDKPKYKR